MEQLVEYLISYGSYGMFVAAFLAGSFFPFSSEWWDYELKTQMLVDDFLVTHNESHITAAGGNTIGALQWGCDKIQITKEFAQYIISRLPD